MDELVAVKVMGWIAGSNVYDWAREIDNSTWYYSGEPSSETLVKNQRDFMPSDDLNHAFEVVRKMRTEGYWFSLSFKTERVVNDEMPPEWYARFRCVRGATRPGGYAHSDTPAMAICEAALKATQEAL